MKIGVVFPTRFDNQGEFLADTRAMETAGVDSIWLHEQDDGGLEILLLAGMAAVTSQLRLGLIPPSPSPAGGGREMGALTNDTSRRFSCCRGTESSSPQLKAGNASTSLPIATHGPPRSSELSGMARTACSSPSTRACWTSCDIQTTRSIARI